MEGKISKSGLVIQRIIGWIGDIAGQFSQHKRLSLQHAEVLRALGIHSLTVKTKKPTVQNLTRPPIGWFKLNCDRSLSNSKAGGWGIIRDCMGRLILAFAHYYDNVSINIAETRALVDSFKYAQTLGIYNIVVESDSKTVLVYVKYLLSLEAVFFG